MGNPKVSLSVSLHAWMMLQLATGCKTTKLMLHQRKMNIFAVSLKLWGGAFLTYIPDSFMPHPSPAHWNHQLQQTANRQGFRSNELGISSSSSVELAVLIRLLATWVAFEWIDWNRWRGQIWTKRTEKWPKLEREIVVNLDWTESEQHFKNTKIDWKAKNP